ncbi:uroporphyrinogen-III C-methyltransferase [Jeongeupia naejangsanensis]|uniref:Uroporphyrinogen-III C-methyltransferase n=1 Tax=Jeongeupia naejangsanensis TaxID=613195 RepID=A0ABS2BRQ6_9NEIS|nr:uroporphyrinogen-III C-methyltransferase [Jeongeupia naejangsanensis]MBM3117666.1 uroporphyrinogen-III C-methyltransferase [Jeongeupia naejangsanensis]
MTQEQDSLPSALTAPRRRLPHFSPAMAVAVVALVAAGGVWLYQQHAMETLRLQVSRELAHGQQQLRSTQERETQAQLRSQALERELALVSARQNETQSQQAALSSMYEALTRNETQRVLAETEQTLAFASQQLQLAGNVDAALVGLNAIDQKLAALNRPELIALRKSINHDIDQLKTQPYLDVVGIAARLDTLVAGIDTLPLAIDGNRDPKNKAAPAAPQNALQRFGGELWHEFRQLIQIRRIDKPDAMLLTPNEAFFLRENIKLRLLDARTALLMRNETAFRADLKATNDYLKQYFDTTAMATRNTIAALDVLSRETLSLKLPDLSASLTAVRQSRLATERAKP